MEARRGVFDVFHPQALLSTLADPRAITVTIRTSVPCQHLCTSWEATALTLGGETRMSRNTPAKP